MTRRPRDTTTHTQQNNAMAFVVELGIKEFPKRAVLQKVAVLREGAVFPEGAVLRPTIYSLFHQQQMIADTIV